MATIHPTAHLPTIALLALLGSGCDQPAPPVDGTGTARARDTAGVPAPASGTAAPTATSAAANAPISDAEEIALGSRGGCVLSKGGTVRCFGDDLVARPVGIDDAGQVAAVDGFVCVVSTKGKLSCKETATGKRTELPVYRDGVAMVGGTHGFAVRTEDGVLRGGYIDPTDPLPKPPSGMPGLKDPRFFALGSTLGCAVLESTVWCWNTEKGHGMPSTMAPVPDARSVAVGRERICVDTVPREVWCYEADRKAKPAKLAGWSGVAALAMAYADGTRDRLCGLGDDGAVRCATLEGDGPAATFPAPTAVTGLAPVRRLGTGASSRSCAITRAGEPWCWGAKAAPPAPVMAER